MVSPDNLRKILYLVTVPAAFQLKRTAPFEYAMDLMATAGMGEPLLTASECTPYTKTTPDCV